MHASVEHVHISVEHVHTSVEHVHAPFVHVHAQLEIALSLTLSEPPPPPGPPSHHPLCYPLPKLLLPKNAAIFIFIFYLD